MTPRATKALATVLLDTPRSADRVGRVSRQIPMLEDISLGMRLQALASRINRNVPINSKFHDEKADIVRELRAIADGLRR